MTCWTERSQRLLSRHGMTSAHIGKVLLLARLAVVLAELTSKVAENGVALSEEHSVEVDVRERASGTAVRTKGSACSPSFGERLVSLDLGALLDRLAVVLVKRKAMVDESDSGIFKKETNHLCEGSRKSAGEWRGMQDNRLTSPRPFEVKS